MQRSRQLFAQAREIFPGGVSSPVRAFKGVGGEPFFVARGAGARIVDADGNEYIDYVLSWGPLVLGHAPTVVLDALRETMARGTSFGTSSSSSTVAITAMATVFSCARDPAWRHSAFRIRPACRMRWRP